MSHAASDAPEAGHDAPGGAGNQKPLIVANGIGGRIELLDDRVRLVKDNLQALPHNGIGFGLLKELGRNPETSGALDAYAGARVLFNYLGQIDRDADDDGPTRLVDARCGPARSARCERAYLIEVIASIADHRLRAEISYHQSIHRAETVNRLGQRFIAALNELIDSATKAESGAVIASDFPLADLDQREFSTLSAQLDALDED